MASSQRSNHHHRQPLILEAATASEVNEEGPAMEIIIRRVGMEDHINIVKLFQVSNDLSLFQIKDYIRS